MSTIVKNNNTSNKMRIKLDEDIFEEVQISYIQSEGRQQEGKETNAIGSNSHTEGEGTIAAGKNQHVQGCYNIEDTIGDYAHIVGNGTSDTNRSNAHTLDWEGNAWFAGDVTGQINENGNITTHILSNKANQSDLNILNNNFNNLTYAASNSVGGPANKVANALTINLQNKEQGGDGSVTSSAVAWTYDGSEARSLNLSIVHYNPVAANDNAAPGLMTAADKIKLNGIAAGANKYSLPTATASTLGGVKIGSNISITSDGVISAKDTTYTGGTGISLSGNSINVSKSIFRDYGTSQNGAVPSFAYSEKRMGTFFHPYTVLQATDSTNITVPNKNIWYNIVQFSGGESTVRFAAQVDANANGNKNNFLYFQSAYNDKSCNWMEITSRVYPASQEENTYINLKNVYDPQDTSKKKLSFVPIKGGDQENTYVEWHPDLGCPKLTVGSNTQAGRRWGNLYLSGKIDIGGQVITADWIAKVNAALKTNN